ncbi:hypothetical protein [Flavihumibacter sp. CACIAM 22H1]|uniref:TolB family protein n=1 Tax=Flavihumibacter sp. CACIAM 22H1 TaxID=1812911 RepID=UPI0007A8F66A|nr:hypothetical protein [Flavihumibacter sp. CACIAM 22H1]KYP14468.1 MAG: hypothetical protein A1D16_18135 [Flavihumibacter sp. CACIAM 22H1]
MQPVLSYLLLILCTSYTAFSQPYKFEPGKISNGGVFGLTISPDSKTALWVHSNGRRDTLLIMESHQKKGQWSKPVIASFSSASASWKDIDPMFSPDGNLVLFQSNRPVPGKPERTGFDIWAVKREKNGWSEAYHLGNTINTDASESYASMASNGNIYFMKENEDQQGKSDIYVSEYSNGQYATPRNLGKPVNTVERESNPFISPEEDYLIYFSTDSAGYGEVDLYISFLVNNQWTTPKNLGLPINSALAEFCPFVHKKEKRLYFSRQQKLPNRMLEDVYYIEFDVEKYR